jgi:hypothetical protein
MAAIRELIQNARDAVILKRTLSIDQDELLSLGIPIRISLTLDPPTLRITDPGVGMSEVVITDFLLSIASDYWNSPRFYSDFPAALGKAFKPAGKFGIGFLSVFMLGDEVKVESSNGGELLCLRLRGVGRRGELTRKSRPTISGTTVEVTLRPELVDHLSSLPAFVKAYAPMLSHDLEVRLDGAVTTITKGWWKTIPADELEAWLSDAIEHLTVEIDLEKKSPTRDPEIIANRRNRQREAFRLWPQSPPEWTTEEGRLFASTGHGLSILCSKGIALNTAGTPGFFGVVNIDEITPDTSRSRALDFGQDEFVNRARKAVRDAVILNLNALGEQSYIPTNTAFVSRCVEYYGREVLLKSNLQWICEVQLPGQVVMLSCEQFIQRMRSTRNVSVSYNLDLWDAMDHWTSGQMLGKQDMVVALKADRTPRYVRREDEKVGLLRDVWPESITESQFLGLFLHLASNAWDMQQDEMLKKSEWRLRGQGLTCHLKRTDSTR